MNQSEMNKKRKYLLLCNSQWSRRMKRGDANMYNCTTAKILLPQFTGMPVILRFRSESIWIHPTARICKSESIQERKLRLTCKWGRGGTEGMHSKGRWATNTIQMQIQIHSQIHKEMNTQIQIQIHANGGGVAAPRMHSKVRWAKWAQIIQIQITSSVRNT